jgi:pimeloyl-ACP methyl ester carboxylesterase
MAFFSLVERLAKRALNASGVHSRYADTSIAKLHVYDAPGRGDLPAVVVLHGISSSAAAFDAHIDEPAVVFGCSLGGAMAINYALERADRVRGLMLASPAGATMDANELERFLKTFQLTSRADASDFMARLYHRAPWYTPLIASELQKLFARPVITSFTSSVRPEHLFTAEKVGSLTMPVHLIWGRSDRLMPPSNLEFYRKSLPGHTVIEEPEGMGHCPHLDNPAALADTICAFARKVAEGSATGARMSA